MTKPLSLYSAVHLPEMEDAVLTVLRSGQIASGPYVKQFEQQFGELIDQSHVVTTIDMTSAMFLALLLSGVKSGDEVLTTPFACLSTNSAIAQIGATAVWVDSMLGSVDMSIIDFESKINANTKAVILYHVSGYPGPAREIAEICKKKGIFLIEDCDNALFASRDSEGVGTYGDFSVYSFYPNRQINTTEGGALICKSSQNAEKARQLRRFGINPDNFRASNGEINPSSDIPMIGWSMTLNNVCSALGCAQLSSVKDRHEKTLNNAGKLKELLRPYEEIKLIQDDVSSTPSFWTFMFLVENRDEVLTKLKEQGISTSIVHQRNDIYSGFRAKQNYNLPNIDKLQQQIIAIPCGWWLDSQQISLIATAVIKAIRNI